jgi:hypothetical protein
MEITLAAKSLEAFVLLFPLLLLLDLDGAIVGGKELSLLSSISLVHFLKKIVNDLKFDTNASHLVAFC